jgi:hypothetical protein
MTQEKKLELVKKLESLVTFQKTCLDSGNWGDYDHAENQIKKLEDEISYSDNEKS